MSHWFISYSHKDEKFVNELQQKLSEQEVLVWTDHQIEAGGDWRKLIDLAIEESIGMLLIVSQHSMASSFVLYEWSFAMGQGKKVIPISVDETRPESEKNHPKLEPIQWVIIQSEPINWFQNLLDVINFATSKSSDRPTMVQRSVELFDSFEVKDWIKGSRLLENNRSLAATEALIEGCNHDMFDIRGMCAIALARKTNFTDQNCAPALLEILSKQISYPMDDTYVLITVMEYLSKNTVMDAQSKLYEFMRNSDDRYQYIIERVAHNAIRNTFSISFIDELSTKSDRQYFSQTIMPLL